MPKQQISELSNKCFSGFQSYALPTTAACQSCPHVGAAVVVCSVDCSNTSCSITEVLDLSPPSPPSHDRVRVWEDKEGTQSVHVCVRGIPGYE